MSQRRNLHLRALAPATAGLLALSCALTTSAPAGAQTAPSAPSAPTFTEPYRPQFHFTPAQNWMNDPNGLVYYKGEYHLFFQYNPDGNQWGNISWGHAVSRDLIHWKQLPLAIPHTADELIFSGSAVVDTHNTSGFGTRKNPAMVAIYTSSYPRTGVQAQSIAYSLDRGRTWTKYAGNPVIPQPAGASGPSVNFRDPKVQWYASTRSWLMTVSLSDQHKVQFYSSKDLKHWSLLSEFGPAGATGGVWECPDLFPLPVDGNRNHVKWVLVVNINPGGIAGGSGAQYFIGDFNGKQFTADQQGTYTPPTGATVQDFESGTFAPWTTTGAAFGPGPTAGNAPGQGGVAGFHGSALANSFNGGDASTGTLTSPPLTATTPYLNFLVGGGNHPHDPNATLNPPAPTGTVFADFEGSTYGSWTTTGDAFGTGPAQGALGDQQAVSGYEGHGLVNTFLAPPSGGGGDASTGTLTSPGFTVSKPYINFLIGGGRHPMSLPNPTAVNLLVDGKVVRTATGSNNEALNWANWDVRDLQGKTAQIQVVDQNTSGWGHLNLDQVTFSDTPAQPRSIETTVNLVVGGKIVQSVTGPNSETLDWASFDLRAYQGKQYQVELIDANTGGWGHILADDFVAAQQPALSTVQRANWVDYGKDYYAAVTWDNAPRHERDQIGWMNNWDYGADIPTSPWRSAQSIPRELSLKTIGGRVRLVAEPVRKLRSLRVGRAVVARHVTIPTGSQVLAGGRGNGKALDITADFSPGSAKRFGFKVRTGNGQETLVGYDAVNQQVFVDRTHAGVSDFSDTFASTVQTAPLAPRSGKVHLRILVDWSSVEVFAGQGQAVITDQIFPDPSSQGVQLFSQGGTARLDVVKLWHLGSYRK